MHIMLAAMASQVALPCGEARASSSALAEDWRGGVGGVEQIWDMVVLTTIFRVQ